MSGRIEAVHPSRSMAGRQLQQPPTAARFADVLQRVLESTPTRAERADDFRDPAAEPTAALELQARLYREAEQLEITTRLLDHGISAVKTILQTRM